MKIVSSYHSENDVALKPERSGDAVWYDLLVIALKLLKALKKLHPSVVYASP